MLGVIQGTVIGVIQGNTRSSDFSSQGLKELGNLGFQTKNVPMPDKVDVICGKELCYCHACRSSMLLCSAEQTF